MSELCCETLHFASADKKHQCAAYIYTMPDVPERINAADSEQLAAALAAQYAG